MSDDGYLSEPALFINDADVAAVANWPEAVDALRAAYSVEQREGSTPERAVANTSGGWMRVMPSAPTGARLAGHKTISAAFRNGQVSYLVALFDQNTSSLVALMDGNRLTGIRTAATAAVALTALAPQRPVSVAIIGSGFEARAQLRAAATVCSFSEGWVFSPTQKNREGFAHEMSQELGFALSATSTAHEAVSTADVILCAARSFDESPTVMRDWVAPHATIISVGSTTKAQRELDHNLIAAATFIVADSPEEVLYDSGDMVVAREAGIDVDSKTVSLADLVTGKVSAPGDERLSIYKSTGSGFQDIVLAERIYDLVRAQGLGQQMTDGILTIRK